MRKFFPHIIASFLFLLCFLVAADAFAQTTTSPLPSTAPVAKVGVIEGYLKEPLYQVVAWIAIGIVSLFAWLVGLAGVLLNFTVTYLVVGMGEMILKNGFGVAIESLWKLVRDLVNLAFIFALLYLGITTIIQGGTSKVKSALAAIIVSMLLVNFSLYFAKAVIDVGNFTAYTIYNVMAKQDGSPGYVTNESIGISGVFADRVGAIHLLTSGNNSVQQRILDQSVSQGSVGFLIVYALGASIFLFMLAFAFAYGAFLLVVRFVTLIIIMISAPIAFLPTNVPAMAKLRDRWIKTLITQAFVAPVYLFGFYLTLLVLMHTPWQTENGLAALFSGGNDFMAGFQSLLFFVVAIGMLIGTTAQVKGMAASGAEVSQALTKTAGKSIAGIASTGGYLGRNIGGRIGRRFAEDDKLKTAAKEGGFSGFIARRKLNTATAAYKGSWDLRNTSAVGAAAKKTGLDVGKGSKENYEKRLKEIKKKELEYAESLNVDDSPEITAAKEKEKKYEGNIKAYREELSKPETTPTRRAELDTLIRAEKENLEDAKKEVTEAKSANQRAYADTVQAGQLGWLGLKGTSIFPARTKFENKKAAEHIRDSVKKKKNKSNTDRLTEAYEKAAEKASKKDDH